MREIDIAVIGSGIGGALIAALNQKNNTVLFEKDHNLGGCASTFCRKKSYYNTGATTFVGYEDNHPIKAIFDAIEFVPDIKASPIAMRTIQGSKIIDRDSDFEAFLAQLEEHYPHPNNPLFWSRIKAMDEAFWQLKNLHYQKYSLKGYLKSFKFFMTLLWRFKGKLFQSAANFIRTTLPNISQEYQDFIDAQLLITVQAKSKDISLLSMALGLAYPFHKVYYAKGGMGKIIEGVLANVETKTNEKIESIEKTEQGYILHSSKGEYCAKKVILNATLYDSAKLFKNQAIKNYYKQFRFTDQSSFVLYLRIDSSIKFLNH